MRQVRSAVLGLRGIKDPSDSVGENAEKVSEKVSATTKFLIRTECLCQGVLCFDFERKKVLPKRVRFLTEVELR